MRKSASGKNKTFASADASKKDKKFEGYSNLKGAVEQQQKRLDGGGKGQEITRELEEEYNLNLQK